MNLNIIQFPLYYKISLKLFHFFISIQSSYYAYLFSWSLYNLTYSFTNSTSSLDTFYAQVLCWVLLFSKYCVYAVAKCAQIIWDPLQVLMNFYLWRWLKEAISLSFSFWEIYFRLDIRLNIYLLAEIDIFFLAFSSLIFVFICEKLIQVNPSIISINLNISHPCL